MIFWCHIDNVADESLESGLISNRGKHPKWTSLEKMGTLREK